MYNRWGESVCSPETLRLLPLNQFNDYICSTSRFSNQFIDCISFLNTSWHDINSVLQLHRFRVKTEQLVHIVNQFDYSNIID